MNALHFEPHTMQIQLTSSLTDCSKRMPLVAKLAKVPSFCLVAFLFFLLLSYLIVIDMLLSISLFCSGTYCTHPSRVGSLFILHMVSSILSQHVLLVLTKVVR